MLAIRTLPLVLLLVACGASTATPTAPVGADGPIAASVNYYQGTSTTTSPDSSTPCGPPAAVLVRRHVDPAARVIKERVMNDGRAFPTTLRQMEGGEFRASDEGETFAGTVTFSGPE
jgi:hypothetical protein